MLLPTAALLLLSWVSFCDGCRACSRVETNSVTSTFKTCSGRRNGSARWANQRYMHKPGWQKVSPRLVAAACTQQWKKQGIKGGAWLETTMKCILLAVLFLLR